MADDDTFTERLRRRRFLRLSGAAGAAGLAGCSQEGLQDDGSGNGSNDDGNGGDDTEGAPVDVGVVIPFSGDLTDFGTPMMNALEMAREDINAAGGPLGREVELHDEDTQTDSTAGVNAANSLVNTQDVSCLVGAVSSGITISIATSVATENGVMQITPASSSPSISTLEDDDLVFRTRTNDRFVAKVMARIAEDEGADSAAVLHINNDFGASLADVFEAEFAGETTAVVGYESGQSSYQQVLSEVFDGEPEFLALAGYPESGTTILSQWNEQGYGGNWILHTSLLSEEVIDSVGAEVMNGMYGVRTLPPTGDATESFVTDYEEANPDAQLFSPYSWNSYDALVSYALAVHAAGTTDSAAVKEEMRTVTNPPGEAVDYGAFGEGISLLDDGTEIDYGGPSGSIDYDDNGDVASDMAVVEVVEGAFEDQETVPADELV